MQFITLDGLQQAPGEQEENTSGGFKFGGWTSPLGVMQKQLARADLLLGRSTFRIFDGYCPAHFGQWPK